MNPSGSAGSSSDPVDNILAKSEISKSFLEPDRQRLDRQVLILLFFFLQVLQVVNRITGVNLNYRDEDNDR